ncbi:hypothetical protein ACNKHK_20570 [Shigella flexneri]
MKYETIDAPQIDDLMARRDVRPPAGWEEPGSSNNIWQHRQAECTASG